MDANKYQQVCTGGLIFNKKEELLVVKRADDDDFMPGYWEIPGGGTDYGENTKEALAREISEELGLAVEVGYPLHMQSYYMNTERKQIHRIQITFRCDLLDETQEIKLSHEHTEYKWISPKALKELKLSDYMNTLITESLQNSSSHD